MGQRQVIRFGKSAFCITLPQSWAKKNRLKKGDSLSVQETLRNTLEVVANSTTLSDSLEPTKSTEMNISEASLDEIQSYLLATYLNGYSVITLRGINQGKVLILRQYLNEFVAAEIMEVTPTKITINVLWDSGNINLRAVIKRIENITRSLFIETATLLGSKEEGSSGLKDILEIGREVQRQVYLARRTITFALNNSTAAHKFSLSSLELYYVSYIVYFFGNIAEYIVEIARIMSEEQTKNALDPVLQKELKELFESTFANFEKVLASYNKQNKHEKIAVNAWTELAEVVSIVQKKNFEKRIPAVPEYLKLIISKIREMEIFIINMENSPR